jgi:uroporphyrinogen III methyltransferase / synthase
MSFSNSLDVRSLGHLNTAAIGPATADMLLKFGLKTDIIPDTYRAESVVEAFLKEHIAGKKILLPRAGEARPILPMELRKMGAIVDEISIYHTIQDCQNADILLEDLRNGGIDMVTFTSSSTVKNFKALIPDDMFISLLEEVTVACIGPITADTARELGFNVHVIANEFTIPGLCKAIVRHYSGS